MAFEAQFCVNNRLYEEIMQKTREFHFPKENLTILDVLVKQKEWNEKWYILIKKVKLFQNNILPIKKKSLEDTKRQVSTLW